MEELKIAVLISGKGSNLQAIAKECSKKNVPARIISIISNNPNASGLQIKGKFKKKVINDKLYDKKGFEFRLQNYLAKLKPDLICLAGFMKILSSLIIKKWKNKIINVHPSLLPSFKGLKTHERVISEMIGLPTVKEQLFQDYEGIVKSLGAWGGDFVLATGDDKTRSYFKSKGFETVISYSKMSL